MSIGPIPWDAIRTYARDHGFDDHATEIFREMIFALDRTYLEWVEAEEKKKADKAGKGKR